jgi:hypothetical protein
MDHAAAEAAGAAGAAAAGLTGRDKASGLAQTVWPGTGTGWPLLASGRQTGAPSVGTEVSGLTLLPDCSPVWVMSFISPALIVALHLGCLWCSIRGQL